ncbi:hypothetical protein BDN72DRAFT_307104 [Pluteus cervinus]|uniref:Uncharacterized protein n=1 Tax=Pluteus cervinus TaxID=181527 RepID=A0ACD3ADI1_9AGAR|nr:hypothetical protein BDN72DRAFT_307104 [Pluteus cervinus]
MQPHQPDQQRGRHHSFKSTCQQQPLLHALLAAPPPQNLCFGTTNSPLPRAVRVFRIRSHSQLPGSSRIQQPSRRHSPPCCSTQYLMLATDHNASPSSASQHCQVDDPPASNVDGHLVIVSTPMFSHHALDDTWQRYYCS